MRYILKDISRMTIQIWNPVKHLGALCFSVRFGAASAPGATRGTKPPADMPLFHPVERL